MEIQDTNQTASRCRYSNSPFARMFCYTAGSGKRLEVLDTVDHGSQISSGQAVLAADWVTDCKHIKT